MEKNSSKFERMMSVGFGASEASSLPFVMLRRKKSLV